MNNTNKNLMTLDRRTLAIIKQIGSKADQLQLNAFIVGGFVRDLIMKRENLDLDIVADKNALQLAQISSKMNGKIISHDRFGTATLMFKDNLRIDFAMARSETYAHSGALPNVSKGSIVDDLYRRDFTINTMAMQINRDHFGILLDLFEGQKDIKLKKIRILHDQSFVDDPTRILRAVRFEQRFQFKLDQKTHNLLKKALAQQVVDNVKPERYFTEFKKILKEEHPVRCIRRLDQLGGLIFLGLKSKLNVNLLNRIEHNQQLMRKKKHPLNQNQLWLCYFMALVNGESDQKILNMAKHFNMRRVEREKIIMLKKTIQQGELLKQKKLSPSQVYHSLKPLSDENIYFLRLTSLSKFVHKNIDNYLKKYSLMNLDINGHDLKRLGIRDGKLMGNILENILGQKIDGLVRSRRDELREARKLIKINDEVMKK